MHSRVNKITHPGPAKVFLNTPWLIPSFSSKGFHRSIETGSSKPDDCVSGLHKQLKSTSEFITKTLLISAYDIYHGHFPAPKDLPRCAEITIVDSGGYEVSDYIDLSDISEPKKQTGEWSMELLIKVLDQWPDDFPAVFVSYDNPKERMPFIDQAKQARILFKRYPNQLNTFLIKPETEDQKTLTSALKNAFFNISEFKHFDIIGVTEREIGSSASERMTNIAALRLALDKAGYRSKPLHIFGALDPILSSLYFMAGAEIFDGLTWLRYAYTQGRCIYVHDHGPIEFGLDCSDELVKARTQIHNLNELIKIESMLREFAHTKDINKLAKLGDWGGALKFFTDAKDSLATQLAEG